jgi:hypothetical protein
MKNIGVICSDELKCSKYPILERRLINTITDLSIIRTLYGENDPKMHFIGMKSASVNSNLEFFYEFMLPNAKRLKLGNINPGDEPDSMEVIKCLYNYLSDIYRQFEGNRGRAKYLGIIGIK